MNRRGQVLAGVLSSVAAAGLGALFALQAPVKDTVQMVAAVVVVLALAGVGLLQLVQKFKGTGGAAEGVEQVKWRTEVTASLGQIGTTTAKMAAYLSDLRHDLLVPAYNLLLDLNQRAEGIEHVIHDFDEMKKKIEELYRNHDRRGGKR